MDSTLHRILEAKEYRWSQRVSLAKNSKKTVICITMCTPYSIRTSSNYKYVYDEFIVKFIGFFNKMNIKVVTLENKNTEDGEYTLFICDEDALKIKEATVKAEEGIKGGRLFDIDVMDSEGNQISRSDINLPSRLCLVCNKNAFICIKEKSHSKDEVTDKVIEIVNSL